VEATPLPFEVRVTVDGTVIATTRRALRVASAAPDAPPTLAVPVDDLVRPVVDLDPSIRGTAAPEGHVAFDPDQDAIEIVVVDSVDGDDERDVTFKRFPIWGDTSDLVAILDVRPDDDGRGATNVRADHRRSVVEASQMLGQAIVAASRRAPGRRVVWASMVFLRVADPATPLVVELGELSAGRTFSSFAAQVRQGGRVCASGTVLADVCAPDVIRHQAEAPPTVGPYASEPVDMSVTGRDIRVVDAAYTGDPDAPVGPPVLDAWVRFRSVPDDPAIHAGLLAQFTGHLSIAAALRPHAGVGQDQAHRSLSTAINAITITFHDEVRVDRWLRYHHLSTYAGHGMTHSECRVHDEDGTLVASFTVEAMVRPFEAGPPREERTAL
jgi:acyl-CoA thioesterase